MTGERGAYEANVRPSSFVMPSAPGGGTAPISSIGNVSIADTVSPAEIMSIADPQERAQAMAAMQGGRTYTPNGQTAPAAPMAAPSAPPISVPLSAMPGVSQATAIPPNGDMRDVLAARGAYGSGQSPDAPAAPTGASVPASSLSQMSGAPTALSSAAEAPKPAMTLADAPAGLSPRDKGKWLLQQTKPSVAGNGTFTPEALNFTAKQYLSGDRQAVQGFARSATARIALQNEIVDEAKRQGLTPEQTASKMAEFAGITAGSRTIGTRAANISLAANEAQEMLAIVKEQSDQFPRSDFVPWNMALKAYESNTGDPKIAAFGASVNALVNVYARAINPTGVPTVSDKEHARAVLNTVQSPAQVEAVLGIINRELEIAKRAPQKVREQLRNSVTGGQSKPGDYSHLWGGNI